MAPAKRKANTAADAASIATTKRQKKVVEPTASSSRPSRNSLAVATAPRSTRSSISEKSMPVRPAKKTKISVNGTATKSAPKTATKVKATDGGKRGRPAKKTTNEEETAVSEEPSTLFVDVPLREKPAVNAEAEEEAEINSEGPAYWYVFSESMFPLLNRTLSVETCLRSVYSVDMFQSSTHSLKYAILTPKL